MSNVVIYSLSHPETGEVRYIGQTKTTLKQRLNSHMYETRRISRRHVCDWIRSLVTKPVIRLLLVLPLREAADQAEAGLIAFYRTQGYRLTNQTDGGEGRVNIVVTAETRLKLSAASIGRPGPNKGRTFPEEVRRKISLAGMGRKHSPETRAKMRASNRRLNLGKSPSAETRLKLSLAGKGHVHSQESRTKMSVNRAKAWVKQKAQRQAEALG